MYIMEPQKVMEKPIVPRYGLILESHLFRVKDAKVIPD